MLEIGQKAPEFELTAHDSSQFSLSKALFIGPMVLYFYPKNETPGCTKEACAFRDFHYDFKHLNARIIGVSQDSVASHLAFKENRKLPFTLLSDPENKVADLYKVKSGLLGLIPGRVTYVIDREGVIRSAFSSQLNIGKHISKALEALKHL